MLTATTMFQRREAEGIGKELPTKDASDGGSIKDPAWWYLAKKLPAVFSDKAPRWTWTWELPFVRPWR